MSDGKPMHVTLRKTSRGNALVHEMQEAGTPMDATNYDHPVTMLYVDGDHLTLAHYCDAGNRPRMVAGPRRMGKKWNSTFSIFPAAMSKGICIMPCSRTSMPTITSRTGLIWCRGISRCTRTWICRGQSDASPPYIARTPRRRSGRVQRSRAPLSEGLYGFVGHFRTQGISGNT